MPRARLALLRSITSMNIRHNSELALASMLTATLLTLWDYSAAAALIDTPVEPPMEENASNEMSQEMSQEMTGEMSEATPDEGSANAQLSADELKFFESEIRPILISNCYGCHSISAGKSKGGLRLDTRASIRRGGKSGPAVVVGDIDSSLLIRAVRYVDLDVAMPPDGPLSLDDVALLEKWIAMGAPDPRDEPQRQVSNTAPASDNSNGASPGTAHRWSAQDIIDGKNNHWSYRAIELAEAPEVNDASWSRSAIDAFLLREMTERGLTHAREAQPATLLRRASFDLTGLPPTDAMAESFARDRSPDAFAHAIDALLASPQFGERWGRHWLDVARYAESSGKESNIAYPHAWRYRDYVIEAFNSDKPYDDFLIEQLAGDLLPAADSDTRAQNLIATGYLALGTKSHNGRGKPQFQMDLADEQIDAVTQGMLGLTVACARCHDHKFDPIPQRDYYAVAGIFLSTDTRYGTFEAQGNNHPASLIELPKDANVSWGPTMSVAQRSLITRGQERAADEAAKGALLLQEALEARRAGKEIPAALQRQVQRARAAAGASSNLASVAARYDERGEPTEKNLMAMGVGERGQSLNARILDRGELDKPGTVVPRGLVQVLCDGTEPKITKGSGRLAFAQWVADENNPLTARVWANRVWLHLFGEPLVPTPDNFGMSGQKPTHPELLDYLATRLIAHEWSTKKLIREIMLTQAYGMSSAWDETNAEIDPDNNYLWRMPQKRLEAEALRDSMLHAGGLLDLVPRPGSVVAFTEGGTRGAGQERIAGAAVDGANNQRSVYLPIMRDKIPEALEVFDFAEPAFVTGQRDSTNVPTQALYLMNSAEMTRMCDAFASRVVAAGDTEAEQITAAFHIAFGRKATPAEIIACRSFLDDFRKALSKDSRSGSSANSSSNDDAGAANGNARRGQAALRERARQRAQANASQTNATDLGPNPAYSAMCQALLLSGEFRTVD